MNIHHILDRKRIFPWRWVAAVDLAITFVILDTLNIFLIDWLIELVWRPAEDDVQPARRCLRHGVLSNSKFMNIYTVPFIDFVHVPLNAVSTSNAYLVQLTQQTQQITVRGTTNGREAGQNISSNEHWLSDQCAASAINNAQPLIVLY